MMDAFDADRMTGLLSLKRLAVSETNGEEHRAKVMYSYNCRLRSPNSPREAVGGT